MAKRIEVDTTKEIPSWGVVEEQEAAHIDEFWAARRDAVKRYVEDYGLPEPALAAIYDLLFVYGYGAIRDGLEAALLEIIKKVGSFPADKQALIKEYIKQIAPGPQRENAIRAFKAAVAPAAKRTKRQGNTEGKTNVDERLD